MDKIAVKLIQIAPVSTCQMGLGIGLWCLNTTGIVPYHSVLFHTRLLLPQPLRLLSPFVLGESLYDVLRSCFDIFMWHVPLERSLNRSSSQQPQQGSITTKEAISDIVAQNKFLHVSATSIVVLMGIEMILDSKKPRLFFPLLDHTLRWIYALSTNNTIRFYSFQVKPIYVCLASLLFSGMTSVKGLVAALGVSYLLELKRDDGKNCIHWFMDFCNDLIDSKETFDPLSVFVDSVI